MPALGDPVPKPPLIDGPDPFAPARLGPIALRNRVLKAATFEGMTPEHAVTDGLVDFHRRLARGGVGMTTVAFCAVSPEGCGTPNEVILRAEIVPGLRRLAEAVHAEGAAVSAQIGHAGAVATAIGQRGLSPSPIFSPRTLRRTCAVTDEDIARIIGDFARGARIVAEGGFDAVEIHLGHGYLPSEFLSPRLNRRTDRWGGSLENRARFPREIARAVREAVGERIAVLAKLNMADGVAGGLWLDESVEVARMLEADGALDAIELTGGSSLENPMYLFRGEAPIAEMAALMRQPARLAFRLLGRRFLREYPFEEAYFLPYARRFRAALKMPLVLLGGVNRLDTIRRGMAEGFEFVAMGRALLREPDLVAKLRSGASSEALCVHCNKCVPTIYRGTHCVLEPAQARAYGVISATGAVEPVPAPPIDVETYYTEAGMDYRAWSRGFNMHFGFWHWPMNPFALEPMLEEMSREVFRRLDLPDGARVLDLGSTAPAGTTSSPARWRRSSASGAAGSGIT